MKQPLYQQDMRNISVQGCRLCLRQSMKMVVLSTVMSIERTPSTLNFQMIPLHVVSIRTSLIG